MIDEMKGSVTILLPAGQLPLDIMSEAHNLAEKYDLKVYLSNAQNLRITNIDESLLEEVKAALAVLGADFKAKGKFPIPKVCVGKGHCNLGVIDTGALSAKIVDRFFGRKHTKPKVKLAISACTLCCAGSKLADIGIIATKDGFEMYAGGKGGAFPKIGVRIGRKLGEDDVLRMVETLIEFHDRKTGKKQRVFKLLSDPEFPYPEM